MSLYSKTLPFLTCLSVSVYAGWSAPITVNQSTDVFSPACDIDPTGHATIVATYLDGSGNYTVSATPFFEGNLGTLTELSDINAELKSPVAVTVNSSGEAFVTWYDQSAEQVWGNLNLTAGWMGPTLLSDPGLSALSNIPNPSLSDSETALAAMSSYDGGSNSYLLQSERYMGSWLPIETFATRPNFINTPLMTSDPNGNALAVWTYDTDHILEGSFYTGSWSAPFTIASNIFNACIPARAVATNSLFHGIVVWQDATAGLKASPFSHLTFGLNYPVGSLTSRVTDLAVCIDLNDEASLVWSQFDGSLNQLYFSRFNGTAFSTPLILDTAEPSGLFTSINIQSDAVGNLYVLWEKVSGSSVGSIWSVYIPPRLFSNPPNPEQISTSGVDSTLCQLAIEPSGKAVATWKESPLGQDPKCVVAYMSTPQPASPLQFVGKQIANKFLFATDLVNRLTWIKGSDSTTASFRLYRNGILIFTAGLNEELVFEDHHQKQKTTTVYTLTSVNLDGVESDPVTCILGP